LRHHLNTLYVSTQGAYLNIERENALVRVDGEVRLRVPLHMLEHIVCFGRVSVSPFLMARCSARGVGLSFLSERGRFLARVQGPVSGNVLLRRAQYRVSENQRLASGISRWVVAAKIANARTVLQRAIRDRQDLGSSEVADAIVVLQRRVDMLRGEADLDRIRGIEGDAARHYFAVLGRLVASPHAEFSFSERTRRPPRDRINALLSFVYTLLCSDVASAVEAVGLDPQVGFLHRDRPGRLGLALDLAEEFRAYIADRLVLSLVNRGQVRPTGFEIRETGAVWMSDETRKTVLQAYQERKNDETTHPFLDEKMTVGMLIHIQARLLARHLRGDLDAYPPFIWR